MVQSESADKFVKPEPSPTNAVASTVPFTSSSWLGLFVPMPTPPVARIRNWSTAVEAKSVSLRSVLVYVYFCAHPDQPLIEHSLYELVVIAVDRR